MEITTAQQLSPKVGQASKRKSRKRTPESQARITAAARLGAQKYWSKYRDNKLNGN